MKLNHNGASLLSVLGITAAISLGTWFMVDRIATQRRISAKLTEDVSYNVALKSITDYAIYFAKNQWCFDQVNATKLQVATVSQCADNYIHPYSTTRLLLPVEYAKILFEQKNQLSSALQVNFPATATNMRYTNSISPYNLPGFTVTALISDIAQTHPVKQILMNTRGQVVPYSVRLYFLNEIDSTLPGSSAETYLRIIVQLLDESGEVIRNGSTFLTETVRLYAAPRENNYFSLILGGSIYLGKANNTSGDDLGSLYFPTATGSGYGVNFYSPVYIQKNLNFSSPTNRVPVTFYDSVVFGVGGVKGIPQNQTLGEKRYWEDLNMFGGFKANFEIDSKLDLGLENIADPANTTIATTNNQNLDMCIKILRSANDSVATAGSQLYFYNTDTSGAAAFSGANFLRNYRFSFKHDSNTGVRKFFKTLSKPEAEMARSGKIENTTSKVEYQIMQTATAPATGFVPSTLLSSTAMYVAIKWNNQILDFIPVLSPMVPSSGTAIPITTQFRLYPNKTTTSFASVNITLNKSPLIGTDEQDKAFKDVTIQIENLNNLTNLPIEYIKFMAFDETCSYRLPQVGPPAVSGTAIGEECLSNPGSGEAKIVYIRKLTNFGTESANCQIDVPYTVDSFFDTVQCSNNSVITIPTPQERANELLVNYRSHINQCFQTSNISTLGSSNEIESQFINKTYNGWEAFPNVLASSQPGFTAYSNITFTPFNSVNAISGAIYNKCTVPSTVGVVLGNFLCKELEIQARTNTLDMIGTFIVTNKMTIDPSAYTAGVDFYTFHHNDAVNFLREQLVFKTIDGGSCKSMPTPHWHPDPGLVNQANRINCSSSSVFKGTDTKYPFRWTSVTADCVHLTAADTNTKCLKRIRNYIYRPLERIYGKIN